MVTASFPKSGKRSLLFLNSESGFHMGSAATLLAVIGEVQGFESKAMRASYGGIALLRSLSPSALSAFLGEPGARYIGSLSLLESQKTR